jgi:hypothetical protein
MRPLWRFAYKLNCKSIAINTKDFKLVCECSPEETNAAVKFYGAKILKAFYMKSFTPLVYSYCNFLKDATAF